MHLRMHVYNWVCKEKYSLLARNHPSYCRRTGVTSPMRTATRIGTTRGEAHYCSVDASIVHTSYCSTSKSLLLANICTSPLYLQGWTSRCVKVCVYLYIHTYIDVMYHICTCIRTQVYSFMHVSTVVLDELRLRTHDPRGAAGTRPQPSEKIRVGARSHR